MQEEEGNNAAEIREIFRLWSFARIAKLSGVRLLGEFGRWRGREITHVAGSWPELKRLLPQFTTAEFWQEPDFLPNPYLRTVVRQPMSPNEALVPVAVVSNSYRLVQHSEVIEKCFAGLCSHKCDPELLDCEVGLTPLGEWMYFRVYLPYQRVWSYTPADDPVPLRLRLECFNSVDRSSRLVIWLGWHRMICGNGLMLRGTKAEIRDVHDWRLNLETIPNIVARAIGQVPPELARLREWEATTFGTAQLTDWVDNVVAKTWGKKAACRVYHICRRGTDVEYIDPFAPGKPSEKPVREIMSVLGAPIPSHNLFHVSQALSWVATRHANNEERVEWQAQIPVLIDALAGKKAEPHQRTLWPEQPTILLNEEDAHETLA